VTAEQWVERFAAEVGAARPGSDEFAAVLELAAVAAHSSERVAAPVACWIAGRTGKPLAELVGVAERMAKA
jgi:hypothetical protein